MCPWPEGIRVTGGFWLLAAWFALSNGWRLLAVTLSAAALHELGHLLALYLLGGRVTGLRLSAFGAELATDAARLPYLREIGVVLAGPAVNLALGLLLARLGQYTASGAHLSLCLFNLLPVRPLDGGRALCLLASWLLGPERGEAAARWEPPRKGGTAGHCRGEGMYDHRWICCRACTSLRRFCESRPKCRVFHPGNEFHRDNYSIVIHVDRMSGMSE